MSLIQRLPFCRAICLLALVALPVSARAQFVESGAGPFNYNDTGRWFAGVINGVFDQTLMTDQVVTFGTYTTLTNGLQLTLGGTSQLTFRSDGANAQSISIVGDVVVGGTANVFIGSHIANQALSIDLGMAPRNFSVAAGRTLTILNAINGSTGGSVQKYGTGTMVMAGALNTMDPTTVWEGTLQFGDGTTNGSLMAGLVVKSGAAVNFNVGSGTNVISNQISGAGSLVKDASGILKLTGDNLYSGGTTINAGTVIAANDDGGSGSATGTGPVTIASGATLQIGDGSSANGSVGGDVQNEGDLIFKREGAGDPVVPYTFAYKISGAGTVTVDGGYSLQLILGAANDNAGWVRVLNGELHDGTSGAYSQNASFTLGSNASIFVAYDETISRLVDITTATAGTVSIGAGARLRIRPTGTDTFSGTIAGAGTLKLGATGTQILAGANTYAGGTIVESGRLQAMNASGSATGSGTVTIDPGATLQIGESFMPGKGAVSGSITNNGTLQIDRSDIFTFASSISGSGDVRFGYGSTRIVTLTGTNTYTGATTITEGKVQDGAPGAFSSASTFVLNSGSMLAANFNETIGGLASSSGSGSVELAANATLTIATNADTTFSGSIAGNGALAKSGTGTLTLSGTNSSTGGTFLNGGTLLIYDNANLGDEAALLTFGGGTLQFAWGMSLTRSMVLDSGGGTLDPQNEDIILPGAISGAGGLAKIGTGSITLKGDNTYSGGTNVTAGRLVLANSTGSGAGTGLVTVESSGRLEVGSYEYLGTGWLNAFVANSGTVQFIVDGASDYGRGISGTGIVEFSGTGGSTFLLGGNNMYSGDTQLFDLTLNDGLPGAYSPNSRIKVAAGAILNVNFNETIAGLRDDGVGPGAVVIGNAAALTVATGTSEDFSFAGTISGAGSLIKSGAGTLTLTGTSNFHTGGTTINGGTLAIASDASLGDPTSTLTFGGGTLKLATTYGSTRSILLGVGGGTIDTNTYEATVNGVVSGAGSLTHQGTGILTLGGANTYTGGTTVQGGGVLDFTADANLGASASGVTLIGGDLRTRANVANFTHAILLAGMGAINTYGFSSTFSGLITGSGSLSVKSQLGGGILTLTNSANQWAGNTYLESGTLRVGATNALPTDNVVKITDGAVLDIGADQTLAAVIDFPLAEIPAAKVNVAAGKTLTVGRAGNDTFNGVFTGSGVFAKQGAGTLTIGAASDAFTGRIDVVGGTLELSAAGSFTGALARIGTGATLKVTATPAVLAALDDYAAGSSGTLLIDGALMLVGAQSTTFSGALTGGGGLTLAGTGELAFAGTSTFTGDVTIQSGTLTVAAVDAFKARTVTVASGATFNVAKSATISGIISPGTTTIAAGQTLALDFPQTLSSVISGAGSVAFNNFNMMVTSTITGAQAYTGNTVVNFGTLEIGAGGTSGITGSVAGNILLNNGATLAFNRATADYSYTGVVTGNGAVSKQGGGTLTLLGASTYTGPTVVKGGTLRLSATNALPTTTKVWLDGGTMLEAWANQIIAALDGSADALVSVASGQSLTVSLGDATVGTIFDGRIQGAGAFAVGSNNGNNQAVTLAGDNTYTGGTTIAAGGTLRLGNLGTTGMVAGGIVNQGVLVFARSNAVTFGGVVSGAGKLQQGSIGLSGVVDTVTLTSANTYSGGTDVFDGRLRIMNSSGSATGSGPVTIHDSGAILGNGTIAGSLVVSRGATIGPGLSITEPARLTVGSTTFNAGGEFAFVMRDATGAAGTDYGLLSISGTLTVLSSSSDPFIISLYSAGGGAVAPAANFDPQQTYSWMIATTTGGITGFDSAAFQVRGTNFQNALIGGFTVTSSAGNMFLNYSPVPEPTTWSLMLGGAGALAWVRRRRNHRVRT